MHNSSEDITNIVLKNKNIEYLINNLPKTYIWYLAGGCVYQTVWNYVTKKDLNYGISDYDILYFDKDVSYDKEDRVIKQINKIFEKSKISLDIKNQCRAHIWYPKVFGTKIDQLTKIEDLKFIPTFTCACIWLYKKGDEYKIYSPYGTEDILNLKLRYTNNTAIPRTFAQTKIDKWISKWPELKII